MTNVSSEKTDRPSSADAGTDSKVLLRQSMQKPVTFPESLPVSERVDDIQRAIENHQVVIIAGETGSGKTTQIPKICLNMGLGIQGLIGHTQPRRIAARTVAGRIAEELGERTGEQVGYQIRFTDTTSDQSRLKVMTDGILLSEVQHDRFLKRYDTIIIDEAHERSLNIDFLLGYLKQLLPKRPDLKVIITSATIEVERFSEFFGAAPVIEVSGRTFPVDVR
jgi:ATP-dependent helicase HrpA